MEQQEIQDAVREIIAKSMRVSLDEVQLDTTLVDLGAESIDFIDMMVGIEHHFNVEYCEQGMFARLEELFGPDVLSKDGELTELGARVLRERRPEIPPEGFTAGFPVWDLNRLFTTETWVRAVQEILEARPDQCGQCGSAKVKAVKGSKLQCEACGATTPCPSQSDVLEAWYQRFIASDSATA